MISSASFLLRTDALVKEYAHKFPRLFDYLSGKQGSLSAIITQKACCKQQPVYDHNWCLGP